MADIINIKLIKPAMSVKFSYSLWFQIRKKSLKTTVHIGHCFAIDLGKIMKKNVVCLFLVVSTTLSTI